MNARVAVIGGSGLYDLEGLQDVTAVVPSTPFGPPSAELRLGRIRGMHVAFLARHGTRHTIPPHRINHRANLWAVRELGARRVLGTSSVGSLRRDLRPGTFVLPTDYLSLADLPTFHDDAVVHATPTLDDGIRKAVASVLRRRHVPCRTRGVYAQTRGPRLETKAEIRLLKDYADVVGMTMASEATLAAELGLPYASLCTVDNYAHGITAKPLTYEGIRKTQGRNAATLAGLLPAILESLADGE